MGDCVECSEGYKEEFGSCVEDDHCVSKEMGDCVECSEGYKEEYGSCVVDDDDDNEDKDDKCVT